MRFIRGKLTFANLVALLALFVALGGSAYAIHLGKNAVKTKNIKNGAVKEAKLADGAITTGKLATPRSPPPSSPQERSRPHRWSSGPTQSR